MSLAPEGVVEDVEISLPQLRNFYETGFSIRWGIRLQLQTPHGLSACKVSSRSSKLTHGAVATDSTGAEGWDAFSRCEGFQVRIGAFPK